MSSSLDSSSFFQKQQTRPFLKLLAAQKQAYIEGKKRNAVVFWATLLFAVVAPMVMFFLPKENLLFAQGISLVISLVLAILSMINPGKRWQEKAALIQEKFDTDLFGLEWRRNRSPIHHIEVTQLDKKLKDRGNIDDAGAEPWYSDYSKLVDRKLQILSMQSENMSWDNDLKKKYGRFILRLGSGIVLFEVLMMYLVDAIPYFEKTFWEAFLILFPPFIGFLTYLFQTYRSAFSRRKDEEVRRELGQAQRLIEKYLALPKKKRDFVSETDEIETVKEEKLYLIQDAIYENRRSGYLVPEFFYKMHMDEMQDTMTQSASDLGT